MADSEKAELVLGKLEKPNEGGKRQRWPIWIKLAITSAVVLAVIATTRHCGKGGNEINSITRRSSDRRDSTWRPAPGAEWQILLNNPLDMSVDLSPNVDIYDLDLYENPAETVNALKAKGKHVICYFSAGTYESWRSDAAEFKEEDKGNILPDWKGEQWLRLSSPGVRKIMAERVKLAASKGCEAIDPDNVDGYNNDNGIGLTESDSISFLSFLKEEASKYNMALGLKNAGEIVPNVLGIVDFCVQESCAANSQGCTAFTPFIDAGKPVFRIEYPPGIPSIAPEDAQNVCGAQGAQGFSTVLKNLDLNGWVQYCNGQVFNSNEIKVGKLADKYAAAEVDGGGDDADS
ncbi:Uncharacterized protein TCAP_02709 [Tolypocladium capitatum]|uniref:alpha-galactosidase n=1 Tax=Tolypocladium capitatum TaxID=45235 RepID=A0A2K3QIJ9_9HYPO|nr:Uncharacterized protein TCAP_02709 [Tolypocladium capitatum]